MKRALILFVVLVALVGAIGGFAYFQFVAKPEMVRSMIAAGGQPPVTVTAEEARLETWQPKLPAIGTLVAISGIEVAAEVSGVVREVHFDSGQDVEAGDLLVSLDDSVEQADLKSGMAELKRTNLDLERQRELLTRGNTSKASYDAALAARDTAAGAVERTRAVIDQKRIEAPFAGRLGIAKIDPGQFVSPGEAMVTLQQLDPIYADFPLPEQNLAVLKVGQEVEVGVDAFPDAQFIGQIAAIDASVDQETRNILLRARIDNPDKRLLPGMFADVAVRAGQPNEVVTVPRTAVTFSLYGDSVYVVKQEAPPGKPMATAPKPAGGVAAAEAAADETQQPQQQRQVAERRFVRSGETRDGRVAILEGVAAGELVVSSGQLKLQPGAEIVVDNSRPLEAPAERPLE